MTTSLLRRKRPVRLAITLLAALAALAPLAGCGGSGTSGSTTGGAAATGSAADLSGVTITAGQSNKLSNHTLLSAAGLDNTPYKIKWADFNATPDMLQAIAAGSVDVGGNGGTTGAIAAFYGNVKVKVAAAAVSSGSGGESSAIIVPKNSPVKSLADLKGKKIALTFGAGVQYYTVLALKQYGLTTSDVQLVNLTTSAALAAFQSGSVDAWAIWDPILATAETQFGARPVLTAGQITALGSAYTFQFVNPQSATDPKKGAAIADFLQRVAKAQAWVNNHLDAWASAGQSIAGLSAPAAALAAKRQTKTYQPIDDKVYQSLQQEADTWVSLGKYPKKIDVSQGFTTAFNDQIAAAASPAGS